jgi:hypothetical protein
MKKKQSTTQEKSFSVALGQIAHLLRTEVKLKERKTKVLKPSATSSSLAQTVTQIGRMLRSQVGSAKQTKKRSWKASKVKK